MPNIRDIIKAATPGPWTARCSGDDYPYIECADGKDIATFDNMKNSTYCATFDPEHTALMEAERVAARNAWGFQHWPNSAVAYNDACVALDTYRKERGLDE